MYLARILYIASCVMLVTKQAIQLLVVIVSFMHSVSQARADND